MISEREYQEAHDALLQVLEQIDDIERSLSKAKFWSLLDLFGGDFLFSMIKRDYIKKSNEKIERLQRLIHDMQDELQDIHLEMMPNMTSDFVFDVIFDNIFTDFRVRSEINKALEQLSDFRQQVEELLMKIETLY